MVEKALLIVIIAAALLFGAGAVGHAVNRQMCEVAAAIGGQARCAP